MSGALLMDDVVVRLYGKRESPQAYAIRDYLQRSDVPFDWVELKDNEQARAELGLESTMWDQKTRLRSTASISSSVAPLRNAMSSSFLVSRGGSLIAVFPKERFS